MWNRLAEATAFLTFLGIVVWAVRGLWLQYQKEKNARPKVKNK